MSICGGYQNWEKTGGTENLNDFIKKTTNDGG
jgi:hypothetical protein